MTSISKIETENMKRGKKAILREFSPFKILHSFSRDNFINSNFTYVMPLF